MGEQRFVMGKKDTTTKLFKAIAQGKADRLKDLKKHARLTGTNENGLNYGQYAAYLDQLQCFQELHRLSWVNIHQKTPEGSSILHICAKYGSINVCQFYMSLQGIEPSGLDRDCRTPLVVAIINDQPEIFDFLVKHFLVDLSVRDYDKNMALHLACQHKRFQYVSRLTQNGSHINAQNVFGNTPLHIAASVGDVSSVKLLLQKGADRRILNNDSLTPEQLAVNNNQSQVIPVLQQQLQKQQTQVRPTLGRIGKKRSSSVVLEPNYAKANQSSIQVNFALPVVSPRRSPRSPNCSPRDPNAPPPQVRGPPPKPLRSHSRRFSLSRITLKR